MKFHPTLYAALFLTNLFYTVPLLSAAAPASGAHRRQGSVAESMSSVASLKFPKNFNVKHEFDITAKSEIPVTINFFSLRSCIRGLGLGTASKGLWSFSQTVNNSTDSSKLNLFAMCFHAGFTLFGGLLLFSPAIYDKITGKPKAQER